MRSVQTWADAARVFLEYGGMSTALSWPARRVFALTIQILTPIARYGITAGGPGHTAFKKLKVLLDRMMLRRTKLERADDLGLPPRTIVVRRDYFSPEEKELYMSLFTGAKRQFATYVGQGTVLNSESALLSRLTGDYSNIFSLITRMRQMACHPDLVLRSKTAMKDVKDHESTEGTVCRLCQDTVCGPIPVGEQGSTSRPKTRSFLPVGTYSTASASASIWKYSRIAICA
jgi:hypothetical protein